MKRTMLSGYAKSKGIPAPGLAVFATGVMMVFGGLGIIFGVYVQISLWLIIAFLFFTSFKMHNFWALSEPQIKMGEMTNFMKNMALLGAALMLLVLPLPWQISLQF